MNKHDESLRRTAELIKSGKARNIVVLTGAGISTSAGIPDFRSPETGLYANLERLNLPFPEAVFELGYFKRDPVPFWTLAKDLYPGKYLPTPTHYFLNLLHVHSLLLRTFTQNIDTLESLSGLPPDRVVEAHGSFASAHCLSCRRAASREYVLRAGEREGRVVRCELGEEGERCGGLVKPDIVFFGEGLPERFFERIGDLKKADLVIVIGTSLQVQPFASLPEYCSPNTPRLLINREPVGPFTRLHNSTGKTSKKGGLAGLMSQLGIQGDKGESGSSDEGESDNEEGEEEDSRDMYWEGDADEGIRRLAEYLGWEDELETMIKDGQEGLRRAWAEDREGREREVEQNGEVERVRGIINLARARPIGQTTGIGEDSGNEDESEEDEQDEQDDGKVPDDQVKAMARMLAQQLARVDDQQPLPGEKGDRDESD